ncbi:DNA photolyase [Primorskyibacter aestuariivivens]|uniref:FAD-binding domain-containing protein n=1 Tax=Primorskyibacter aestuariivivens TaxID=1888912 RepID=UPI002301F43C|nr:FAD-binding domain-containing protein [Primorskyibacter aestuariivivens]MDA7427211.1 DNA photolyase [Primorskyibacter aestuariivivens]
MTDTEARTRTRAAALARLRDFLPRAGRDYARLRNFDLGPGRHAHVSGLSPYLRHRLITEEEVLKAMLARHSPQAAGKFIQEVFWRSYWKGWLEMRPGVWDSYRAGLARALDDVQTQSGLRRSWEAACSGQTGITCFDHWAQELVQTGYLHNHARMWFASIWIFTLHLPWELGADFFLRHLLDGCPASNTLGWCWVGGLQTRGKTYLTRPDNIARFTEGRFFPAPGELASTAPPLTCPDHPPRRPIPQEENWDPSLPSACLLTSEDLHPGPLFDTGLHPFATATWQDADALSPLMTADHVAQFKTAALQDATTRWADRLGPVTACPDARAIARWATTQRQAHGITQIVAPYAPAGPTADMLSELKPLLAAQDIRLIRVLRPYDARAWPHATHGFFRFKDRIPGLLSALNDGETLSQKQLTN